MSFATHGRTVVRGVCGRQNPRNRTHDRLAVEAHKRSSRFPHAGLFLRRNNFRAPHEDTTVVPVQDLPEMHGYAKSSTQASAKAKKTGPTASPILLVILFLVLNANLHIRAPDTSPITPNLQSMIPSLTTTMYILSITGAARMLPVLGLARPIQEVDFKKIVGSALLVAGGTVGAGIVALPVKTASVGLLPSAAGLIGGWAFMLLTAFVIVEVSEYCGPGYNFTSMTGMTLGSKWKAVSAALYIFVYCATLTAYIAESATFIGPPIAGLLGRALPPAPLAVLFTAVMGAVVAMGSRAVDVVNSTCVLVALAAFGVLMCLGGTGLNSASLLYANWAGAIKTAPIMIVAFTFHNMIPSLYDHLKSAAAVQKALIIGTLIPLVMYLMWEVLILGSLPPGSSLSSVGQVVERMGSSGAVPAAINIFSLFAIVTSFIGVGTGCIDFIKDLAWREEDGRAGGSIKILATAATMAPPLLIACLCPSLFVAALEISGMLRLILFAIIPGMMLRAGPLQKAKGRKGWVAGAVALIATAIILIDVVGRLAPAAM